MKIIHCADIHLDSKMEANLTSEQAKERRAELLATFQKMVRYAVENEVGAIIIAGDLYDKKSISAGARNVIRDTIINNPQIDFYYLKGNHDAETVLNSMEEIPANLKMFENEWTSYHMGNAGKIVLTGVELDRENSSGIYDSLILEADKFNIVTMHGQIGEYSAKDKGEHISLRNLKNKGIDYLALGHVHKYCCEELDGRGKYCYPGCLEGRGFDECGEHGFVLVDIDEENSGYNLEFVPMASRKMYEINVDVSGCMTTTDIQERIGDSLEECGCSPRSMVKIVLVGEVDLECEKNITFLTKQLEDRFYFVKMKDKSKLKIDYREYAMDASLKGEFIRLVESQTDIDEEEKTVIIRYGIQALAGEELM